MAKEFRTGIVITGDAKGGIKAVKLTDNELKKLGDTQKKGAKVQKKSRKETDKSSKSMKGYAGNLGLVSTAAGLLTTVIGGLGIASVVRETVAVTKETNGWANAIGVSTQELQAAEFATQSLGLSQGKIADIYKDTAEKIADAYINGGGEAVEALAHLNLTAAELVNLSPDKQLLAIAGGLDAVGSNAAKIQILESLASDASLLIPLLDNNAEKFNALKNEAIDTGFAMSALDAAKVTLLGEEFRKLSATATGFGNEMTVALTPVIRGISQEITALTSNWGGMGSVTENVIDATVTGIGFLLDVFQPFQVFLKYSEIGWLQIGKVSVDAFMGAGQAGVDLLNAVLQPIREVIGAIVEGYGYLIQAAAEISGNESWKKAAEFALGYADAIKTTRFEMNDFVELQGNIETQLAASNAELKKLVDAGAPSKELNEWIEKQRKEVDALAKANLKAADARKELTDVEEVAVETTKELGKELKTVAEPIAQIYEDTASSIRSSFSGAFRDALDGQNSFADRMKNVFKDMLADMATMAIAKPIIIPLVSGLGGFLGVSGSAQASTVAQLGGGLAGAGAFTGSYAGFSGEQGAILAAQTSEFGTAGAVATAQAGGGSGFMEAAGATLGAGFMGYMAGGVAADLFNVANPKMTSALTGVGAMIGSAMGGPIVGALVGFAAGSLLGGKYETKNSGLELSIAGGDLTGRAFRDQKKKGGLFSSNSSRTLYGGLDKELRLQLQGTFESITENFSDMGETLGRDADSVLANFATSARLSLQGLSNSEISGAIDAWMEDIASDIALDIMPGLIVFQRTGESAAKTFTRITNAFEGLLDLDQSISDQIFIMTGGAINQLVSEMGSDIEAINGLSISGFGQNLSTELATYAVGLTNVGSAITGILNSIAATSDPSEWLDLEQQLLNKINQRYQLENEMLTKMQDSIRSVISDIGGLRGAISNDIGGILNSTNYRGVSAIENDINVITPSNAPAPYLPTSYDGRISDALANIENQSVFISNMEAALEVAKNNFVKSVYGGSTFERSKEILFGLIDDSYVSFADYANDVRDSGAPIEQRYALAYSQVDQYETAINDQYNVLSGYEAIYKGLIEGQKVDQQAATEALIKYNAALNDYISLTSDQVNQLQKLRDETLRYYQAQKQLADTMAGAANNLGGTIERLRLSQLTPVARVDDRLSGFRGLANAAENVSGYDLVNISGQLNGLVDPLLSEARNLFASGQGYQDIYNEIVSSLGDIQGRLIDETPIGFEQESVSLLNSIDGLLGTLQGELSAAEQAIVDAINLGRVQTVEVLQSIRSLLGDQSDVIVNGSNKSGLSRVPFDGYISELHKDEAVIDAGTMSGLRKYGIPVNSGGGSDVSKLLPALERIAKSAENSGGDINIRVVTPDGKQLKEETIRDIKKRSQRGESVIHINGVVDA